MNVAVLEVVGVVEPRKVPSCRLSTEVLLLLARVMGTVTLAGRGVPVCSTAVVRPRGEVEAGPAKP